jgi:hypothetical protein
LNAAFDTYLSYVPFRSGFSTSARMTAFLRCRSGDPASWVLKSLERFSFGPVVLLHIKEADLNRETQLSVALLTGCAVASAGTFGTTNSNRRLKFQNSNEQDAGFANQRGTFDFGLPVRVSSSKAAGDFTASKCQVHTNRFSMLVRDKFTPPFAILERVRSRIIEIAVATQNKAIGQNNYPRSMALFAIPHFNTD